MGKIKYLFNRITSMSYKRMFQTLDAVKEKTGRSKIILFFDMVYCGLRYQAGYIDYDLFEMYNLNRKQRKTIITRGINNSFVKKYNDKEYSKYFHNKLLFNEKYGKYLHREYIKVTPDNYDDFVAFALKHKEIVIKPVDGTCGKGIEIVKVDKKNVKEIYDDILKTNRILVEEKAVQIKEMSNIYPTAINTVRIVTLKCHVVAAYLRIGNKNHPVDNFNSEGLAAPINLDTGVIDYVAVDKKMNLYERHPMTNAKIKGFKIPNWEQIKEFTENASKEVPQMGYVGWDVSQNDDGPYLIEANEFPGHDIYQLPPHRTNGIGMLPIFKEALKK